MPVDDEVHFARALSLKTPHEIAGHRCAKRALKDTKHEMHAIRDRRDRTAARAPARCMHDGRLADERIAGARDMIAAVAHFVALQIVAPARFTSRTMAGHSVFHQRAIATWFRSSARRTGFCTLMQHPLAYRLTVVHDTATSYSRGTNATTTARVHS